VLRKVARASNMEVEKVIISVTEKHPHKTKEGIQNDAEQEHTSDPRPVYTGQARGNYLDFFQGGAFRTRDHIGRRSSNRLICTEN
jgi:hypothetical protein